MLELDVGNTRIKWRRLGPQGTSVASGVEAGKDGVFEFLAQEGVPSRVRISCVRDQAFRSELASAIESCWGLVPEFAESVASYAGLSNAYAIPEKLGVDRWLAMLAAQEIASGKFCVLDAGSALTLDFVEEGGRHLGGYIVPGLSMQKKVLLQNTAIRIPEFESGAQLVPGRSTEAAILNGVMSMAISWIVEERHEHLGGSELFLTGGDALLLMGYLQKKEISCSLVPELVMDGLSIALP